jgi:nitrogen-specific signal transduction histidine kinase
MPIEDRKLVHDLRNSIMVIRNLTQLIEQGVMKGTDKDEAYRLILAECDKIVEILKKE